MYGALNYGSAPWIMARLPELRLGSNNYTARPYSLVELRAYVSFIILLVYVKYLGSITVLDFCPPPSVSVLYPNTVKFPIIAVFIAQAWKSLERARWRATKRHAGYLCFSINVVPRIKNFLGFVTILTGLLRFFSSDFLIMYFLVKHETVT